MGFVKNIFEFDFGNGGNSVLAFGGIRIVIIELFPQRFGCLYSHKALHQFSCAVEEAAGKITDGQSRTCWCRTDHSSQQGNEKKNDLPDYQSYDYHDCPYCKAGRKVDALVNSFGYSSL